MKFEDLNPDVLVPIASYLCRNFEDVIEFATMSKSIYQDYKNDVYEAVVRDKKSKKFNNRL